MGDREELFRLILEKSLELKQVVLSSGKTSNYYIDCKLTTLRPDGAYHVASIFLDWILQTEARAVGGPVIGADPIVGAMAALSHQRGEPIHAFLVRKAAKEHGKRQKIEGVLIPGEPVVILDDVVTTGGSLLRAVDEVEKLNCPVVSVFTVVDRQEGARENLERRGLELKAIFTRDELLEAKRGTG